MEFGRNVWRYCYFELRLIIFLINGEIVEVEGFGNRFRKIISGYFV